MNTFEQNIPARQAAMSGLAVVGFIALVAAGIWFAVYSTRYVPTVVGRIGSAAVYLGSVFTPAPEPSLSVVPTASSTVISFGEESSTTETTTSSTVSKPATQTKLATPTPTAGEKTNTTYQINSTTTAPSNTVSGLPDLIVNIKTVGYLMSTSTDSFIATSTVPYGNRPAVNFTIKNVGTNATGAWCFSATIPTQSSYLYQSQPQQSLAPGDSIDYTLGFDQANKGVDQMVSVTANIANTENTATCSHTIIESNSNNNSASTKITISGGP